MAIAPYKMDDLEKADKFCKEVKKDKKTIRTFEKGDYFESKNNFDETFKYYEEIIRLFLRNYESQKQDKGIHK